MKPGAGIAERLVEDLWERQALNSALLDKIGLRVVYRGSPSDAGGPDYQDAILSWGEREIARGDVEFHVRASDWFRHGHQRDSNYNRVILHVVWIHDLAPTVRADGQTVPVLCVGGGEPESASAAQAAMAVQDRLLTHPCVSIFGALAADELRQRIREVGLTCFRERVERFAAELTCVEPDQAAYGAILEALGYASNREPFQYLADLVPYSWLQSISSDHWAPTLLDAAGLGPRAEFAPPGHLDSQSWRLTSIRPNNHPALRLVGVSLLLQRLGPKLAEKLCNSLASASRPAELRGLFMVEDDGRGLIGSGRADELVVSFLLPFVAALEPYDPGPEELFVRYPAPPINRWTRIMQDLLRQAGHELRPRTAPEHQGLHFLYQRFCRPQRSAHCPICGNMPMPG